MSHTIIRYKLRDAITETSKKLIQAEKDIKIIKEIGEDRKEKRNCRQNFG